jgi:hypothetical protein
MEYTTALEELAKCLMFSKADVDLTGLGLTYRKGKDSTDIKHAVRKALKNGQQKTEHELSILSLYLKTVVKTAKLPTKV